MLVLFLVLPHFLHVCRLSAFLVSPQVFRLTTFSTTDQSPHGTKVIRILLISIHRHVVFIFTNLSHDVCVQGAWDTKRPYVKIITLLRYNYACVPALSTFFETIHRLPDDFATHVSQINNRAVYKNIVACKCVIKLREAYLFRC